MALRSPFAVLIGRGAQSRTWRMLPAGPSSSSTVIVWIESTTTSAGRRARADSMIAPTSLVARTATASAAGPSPRPSRDARSRSCPADSSPVAYNTPPCTAAIPPATWRSSVDFPTPGSPPMSRSDPGTIPPPSTRSSSGMPVGSRSTAGSPDAERGTGRVLAEQEVLREDVLDGVLDRATQRSRAKRRVPADLDELILRGLGHLQAHVLRLELLTHALEHEVDDLADLVDGQAAEDD